MINTNIYKFDQLVTENKKNIFTKINSFTVGDRCFLNKVSLNLFFIR